MKYHIKLYSFVLLSALILCFITCIPVSAKGTKPSLSDVDSTNSQLIGQSLLKTKTEMTEKYNILNSEIESINNKIRIYDHRGQFGTLYSFVISFFHVSIRNFILIACVWSSLLLFMYRKIHEKEYLKNKRLLILFLFIFIAIGFLCIITNEASANDLSIYRAPKSDLPETLQHAKQSVTMEPQRRVLEALEEQNCANVAIPNDVISWISQNCRDAEILNPIQGSGPHRLAAIASIYWSLGEKEKAIEVLKPILNEKFNVRSSQSKSGFKTAISLFTANMDSETTGKIARKMIYSLNSGDLVWMAKKLRLRWTHSQGQKI